MNDIRTLAHSEQLKLLGLCLPKSITQGNPFLRTLLWVLAVAFQCFLGNKFHAFQCEQILGNPCFDLSNCWVCFVCFFLILQHYFETKDCFASVYCHVMQQWKLVLQKETRCLCPKEAPVNVFKPDVTRHLSVLEEQAGNAFMAIQRR